MEKKHRRSHEEVVAARAAYAKERYEKQAAKEARKVEREKLAAERAERRKLREERKNMSPEELHNSRMEQRVKKARKKDIKKSDSPFSKYQPYGGEVRIGDTVKAYFAGVFITGKVYEIVKADEEIYRKRCNLYKIHVSDRGPYNDLKCTVQKEKIIDKV